jgi:Fe-S-cluster containining protein
MASFKCLGCSKCCRGLTVPVVRLDLARWLSSGLYWLAALVVRVEGLQALRAGSTFVYALPKRSDGSCLLLQGFRCSIYSARPLVCMLFPFAYSARRDDIGLHPWSPSSCEAVKRGLTEPDERERGMLLAIARTLDRELKSVDEHVEEYEAMIAEARARLQAKLAASLPSSGFSSLEGLEARHP